MSGQLQFASEDVLKSRGFRSAHSPEEPGGQRNAGKGTEGCRRQGDGDDRGRFVVPIEEMVAAFWECPEGKEMKVGAGRG